MSSCPSSKDSPPSRTKPFTGVCAPEGYVEEGRGKSIPADLASQYRHVGLPVREHNATQTQTHTINTLTRAQSEPRGESCPPPDRGRNRRESSAHGDTHAEATSKDAASECHAADTPRGGAVHYNEADGRSSCIVGGGCATRHRQRAGNHGICCGRGMPHVTREVVQVFQVLGREKTFVVSWKA